MQSDMNDQHAPQSPADSEKELDAINHSDTRSDAPMEKRTDKQHPEFDLPAAKKAYAKVKEELCGEQITSPYDLYSVERLRDEHHLRQGLAFATDVFVFGKGPPPDGRLTKVSGLPFWPQSRKWPAAEDGSPCQFLAQFCFLDSGDLAGQLPGDILLLFVPQNEGEWIWELDQVRFEWLPANSGRLIDQLPKGVAPYSQSEWYGVIHRTHDYPGMMEQARKLEVDQPYNLPVINGSKIGGIPHAIQSKANYAIDPTTGRPVQLPDKKGKRPTQRFLCQLSSIQAAPEVAHPWTNRKKALTLEFDETGIYGDTNQCLWGDMGSIYVSIEPSGQCVAATKCY